MATEKQNAANAENAQKSTGPKTQEGKDASKRNAMKYGITGAGIVRPQRLHDEVDRVIMGISPRYNPLDLMEVTLVRGIAGQMVNADEAVRQGIAQRNLVALRRDFLGRGPASPRRRGLRGAREKARRRGEAFEIHFAWLCHVDRRMASF